MISRANSVGDSAMMRFSSVKFLWSHSGRWILGILGFVVVIAVWYAISAVGIFKPGLLPTPDQVAVHFAELSADGILWENARVSVQRVAISVLLGVIVAIPVGFLLGSFINLFKMFDPVINFFRALPPIALIPLVVVYFGIGEEARLAVLLYAAFFSSIVVIYEGVVSIDPIYVRAARVLGATRYEIFRLVILPLMVPTILVALRVALGVTWASLVAAELVAAQTGLGAMISEAGNFFKLRTIYAGIIAIGVAALVMDALLRIASNRLIVWQERGR